MAAAGSTAEVFLGMNVKKFIAGAKKGILASKQLVDKFAANQQRMRNMSLKTGIALGAQVLWIRKVTKAASIQETAEKKLADAVLKNTDATMANVDALIDQAAALQQVTKFGDETIIEAQSLLATYGVATEHLEAATEATLDFASATGRDLKTAALTVGKAVGAGFTAELSRYGIILDVSTIPKTEVATAVIGKMADMFGGRARQDAETFSGRLAGVTMAIGDLEESIGFTLFPIIEKLLDKIKPIVNRMAEWIERNEALVAAIIGVGVGGTGLLFALSTAGFLITGMSLAIGALSPVLLGIIAVVTLLAAALIKSSLAHKEHTTALQRFSAEQANLKEELSKVNKEIQANKTGHEELTKQANELRAKIADNKDISGVYAEALSRVEAELIANSEATKQLTGEKEKLIKAQRELSQVEVLAFLSQNRLANEELLAVQAELEQKIKDTWKAFQGAPAEGVRIREHLTSRLNENKEAIDRNNQAAVELQATLEKLSLPAAPPSPEGGVAPTGAAGVDLLSVAPAAMEEADPFGFNTFKDRFALINEELENHKDKAESIYTGIAETRQRLAEETADFEREKIFQSIAHIQTFFGSLEGMAQRFQGVVGKTIVGGLINTLKSVIDAWVATEVAKATVSAPLSFGATLAAIGPITAAGAAGKGVLSAILGSMDSFQFGGIVRETGPALVHKGERIINPEHPESFRNAGMGGDINQSVAFYGPINHRVDIADASRELAKRTRLALNGGF